MTFGGKFKWLIIIGIIIEFGIIGCLVINQPRLINNYPAEQLGLSDPQGSAEGFFKSQADPNGETYVWTQGKASLRLDIQTTRPVKLRLAIRSAALAGGKNEPVQILVNSQPQGQVLPSPDNQSFQNLELQFSPPHSDSPSFAPPVKSWPLVIELVTPTFRPGPQDNRALGTMIQNITVDTSEAWAGVSRWEWLLGLLPVSTLLGSFFFLVYKTQAKSEKGKELKYKLAGMGGVGFLLAGELVVLAFIYLYGRSGKLDASQFGLWWFGLGVLALLPVGLLLIYQFNFESKDLTDYSIDRPLAAATALQATASPTDNGTPLISDTATSIKIEKPVPLKDQIDSLTGLRFVAALLVYFSHLPQDNADLPKVVSTFMYSGYNGVSLFFVLSGFVICYNYFNIVSTNFKASLKPFFVARFARVYPMYLLMFLFAFFSADIFRQLADKWPVLLQQVTVTQAWNPDVNVAYSYNAQSWSVSVEAFLYLTFPFMTFLLLKRLNKISHLLILGGVAYAVVFGLATWFGLKGETVVDNTLASHYWLYRIPLVRLGDFILGCVAARIFMMVKPKPISLTEQRIALAATFGSVAAVGLLMSLDLPFLVPYRYDVGYNLFFIIIIYCLARYTSPLKTFLSSKLMVLLGEASYSFYLLHVFIIGAGGSRLQTKGDIGTYFYGFLLLVMVCLISLGAYTYIETPMRKYLRRKLLKSG